MILGSDEIRERLNNNDIFRAGTWDDESIKEASYALRVAADGMIVDGKIYEPELSSYPKPFIEIKPGSIAILSTIERLNMPGDLVGKLGIRLDYAAKGLTGLMGFQVDPYYGQDRCEERLYIRVANFGNESIRFRASAPVFSIEFSEIRNSTKPSSTKISTWDRLIEVIKDEESSNWNYTTKVSNELRKDLTRAINGVRDYQQPVVFFGVFLVAITILSVMVGLILDVRDAPNWVTNTGWIALMILFFVAAAAIVGFVTVAAVVLWKAAGRYGNKSD